MIFDDSNIVTLRCFIRSINDCKGESHSIEKKTLDNSLVDLEFRFNELVTHDDDKENENESGQGSSVTSASSSRQSSESYPCIDGAGGSDDGAARTSSNVAAMEFQSNMKAVIEQLEGKVHQLDVKITDIGKKYFN